VEQEVLELGTAVNLLQQEGKGLFETADGDITETERGCLSRFFIRRVERLQHRLLQCCVSAQIHSATNFSQAIQVQVFDLQRKRYQKKTTN
jgi:hypothetical protein